MPDRPHVVALGNQKGGSGKSTAAIHLVVGLLHRGLTVGAIDLDSAQATLMRFLHNRERSAAAGLDLALPTARVVPRSTERSLELADDEELASLEAVLVESSDADVVVIDLPGDGTFLALCGHFLADTLVTPINDSLLDLDALVRIDPDTRRVAGASPYTVMVGDATARRAAFGAAERTWIVMRNRLAHVKSRNTHEVERLLDQLAPQFGFRVAPGFGERVIFRQLFGEGLTALDLDHPAIGVALSKSHLAARREVEALVNTVLPAPVPAQRRAGRGA